MIALDRNSLDSFSINDIIQKTGLTQAEYYLTLKHYTQGTSITLKRDVSEIYVNNYNQEWLNAWDANMDIQICLDYYAILTYITDYYTKADNGCMQFLKEAAKKCAGKDLKDKMHCLSQAFLSHRQAKTIHT